MLIEVIEKKKSQDPKLVALHFSLSGNVCVSVVRIYNQLVATAPLLTVEKKQQLITFPLLGSFQR